MREYVNLSFSIRGVLCVSLLVAAILASFEFGRNSAVKEMNAAKARDAVEARNKAQYLSVMLRGKKPWEQSEAIRRMESSDIDWSSPPPF